MFIADVVFSTNQSALADPVLKLQPINFPHLQSIARNGGAQVITEEVLASCSGGPRGNEQLSVYSIFYTLSCTPISHSLNQVHI